MRNFTWNRFPVKNLQIDSLLTPIVESTYLKRVNFISNTLRLHKYISIATYNLLRVLFGYTFKNCKFFNILPQYLISICIFTSGFLKVISFDIFNEPTNFVPTLFIHNIILWIFFNPCFGRNFVFFGWDYIFEVSAKDYLTKFSVFDMWCTVEHALEELHERKKILLGLGPRVR